MILVVLVVPSLGKAAGVNPQYFAFSPKRGHPRLGKAAGVNPQYFAFSLKGGTPVLGKLRV